MPASTTVLPREKPAPKEAVKTKWEKFREEKGLPSRKKRSRLVFDPI
jgi:regulator of ribosome biosynthesis